MSVKRRNITKEFKLHVLQEVDLGKKTAAEIARQYQIHPNLITKWRSQYEIYKEEAFAGAGHVYSYQARIAALERKTAQLEAENDLLKKALSQRMTTRDRHEIGQGD